MTPRELVDYAAEIAARHASLAELIADLEPAPSEVESTDHRSDGFAEAIFLRAFTNFESDVEKMFLHYVTGGASLSGVQAESFLSITDSNHARQITKAGYKFLGWAKPADIRTTARTYIRGGWPLVDMMATKEQILADCERVRNRIAHNSLEARQQFGIVQRNYLQTERLFELSAGQFLRMRSTRLRLLHIAHLINTLNETLEALIDPRP